MTKEEKGSAAVVAADLPMTEIVREAAQVLLKAIKDAVDDRERARLATALSDLAAAWAKGADAGLF